MGCVTDSEKRGNGIWMELDPVSTHRPMKVEELIESQKRRIAKKLNMLGVWEEKKKKIQKREEEKTRKQKLEHVGPFLFCFKSTCVHFMSLYNRKI